MLNYTEADIEDAFAKELVFRKVDPSTGYTLYSYSKTAPWTPGAFDNPFVRAARGLIVDIDGNVVARPWPKFFNYGQEGCDQIDPDLPVEVTDKADGSLGILYLEPDGTPRIATRGSFDSEQAKLATKWIQEMSSDLDTEFAKHWTFLFEIIYPENRIVVDYGGFEGLVLLGAVYIPSGTCIGPESAQEVLGWFGRTAEVFAYKTLKEALEAPPRDNAEGLVVRQGNKMLKIKQEDYIRLHKIVTGLNKKTVWQAMVDDTFPELLDALPDEFHGWALEQTWDLDLDVGSRLEDVEYAYEDILEVLDTPVTRGQFAQHATQRGKLAPYLFAMYDNKDVEKMILKSLKPILGVTDD